jgi:formyl-CoA transferase/CoA:oxalate CoA-transferase
MPAPLEGLRVVDLTENLAGPFCTMILADMGAEVVKVERPGVGDESRRFPPFVDGESAGYLTLHRGKKSVALDLKDARGREALGKLVARADVLVEAFRPGTLDRLGLGPAALRAAHPRLVVCSLSGFGQTGPYRERGGYDLIAQAMAGLMSVTGEVGRPPAKCGLPVTDIGCGMWAAIGILLALRARDATGEGQCVDTSLFEVPLAWGSWHAARYFATGEVVGPLGSAHPSSAPYQAFQGSDGQWFVLAAGVQHLWERLCKLVDRPDLAADPRFATNAERVRHARAIEAALDPVFRRRPAAEWIRACEAEGIPAGPVNDLAAAYADPQARARQMVVELEHPTAGRHRVLGIPVKLSATPGAIRGPAPRLGEHTEEVLRGLGYPAEDARALADAGRVRPGEVRR